MALVKKIMSCHPQVTVAMWLIGMVVSMCFGLIYMLKAYHRVQQSCTIRATFSSLAIQGMLTRSMALSPYSLMLALFDKAQTYVGKCVTVIFS